MKEHVLVVDDQRDNADSLARLIRGFGFESKAVYDGEEALDEIASFAPDMAMIDIGMPGLNGFETVERIRRQKGNEHVILVAVTGWTRDEDKRRAYASGFDLHVAKPLSLQSLVDLLALLDPSATAESTPLTTCAPSAWQLPLAAARESAIARGR